MAIDFNKTLLDEKDEPIKHAQTGIDATLKDLLLIALAYPDKSGEDKEARWKAIKSIKSCHGLTQDDKELCKKWVSKVFLSPVVSGVILDELGE